MSNRAQRRSPLGSVHAADTPRPNCRLFERPFLTHVNLRIDPNDVEALDSVRRVLGVALPLTPNTTAQGDGLLAIWLGPDEWLLLADQNEPNAVVAELQAALTGRFASVVDISAGQTVIRLRGPATCAVLARGCALNLDPSTFPPGACVQTLLARAQALLVAVDAAPTIDILVRRSFAPYVAAWLEDSGREFGLRFPT